MAKGNDRVKEGRSRVGLLMDDEILDVIDKIAAHEGSSRSKIMLYLITESLGRRGLTPDDLKFPEYPDYWVECMKARPKGSFFEGPREYNMIDLSSWNEPEDPYDRPIECECGYPDELSDHMLHRCINRGMIGVDENDVYDTQRKIQEINEKYKEMHERLYKKYEEEQRRLEQLMNQQARITDKGSSSKSIRGKK